MEYLYWNCVGSFISIYNTQYSLIKLKIFSYHAKHIFLQSQGPS